MIASQPFSYVYFIFTLHVLSVFVVKFRGCFSATFKELDNLSPAFFT